jgi:hypothetical protein
MTESSNRSRLWGKSASILSAVESWHQNRIEVPAPANLPELVGRSRAVSTAPPAAATGIQSGAIGLCLTIGAKIGESKEGRDVKSDEAGKAGTGTAP